MAIYRGPGGPGDATQDAASEVLLAVQAKEAAQAAQAAAEAAQAAAELAETNAETAETNAETAETNAETAETNAEAAQAAAEVAQAAAEAVLVDPDFQAVVAIEADITTVAGIAADVTTVAGISADVTTVASIDSDVTTVASDIADVTTVASNIGSVNTVSGISSNVTTVAGISSNVTTVAGISSNVTTVAGISGNVTTVATNNANVTTVATNIANINTVASDLNEPVSEINTVATDIANVNTVGTNIANVNTVAGISADVTTVAGDSADIQLLADNIATIASKANAGANSDITSLSGLTTPLSVAQGGTGAATLTGYVKGSGTTALTASSTIPNTDITGLGTMSTQAASNVAITGGSINGTTVGATTASTGKFTTLEATGVTTVQAGTVSAPAITTSGDTNTGIFFPAADTIAFAEGGVEAMRINSSGNVGIGMTPSAWISNRRALEIGGASAATLALNGTAQTAEFYFNSYRAAGPTLTYASTGFANLHTVASGAWIWYNAPSGTGGTTATFTPVMALDASGNLGLGTTSPTLNTNGTVLHINNSTASRAAIIHMTNAESGSAATDGLIVGKWSDGINYFFDYDTNPLVFGTSGAERMRIDSSGNVGIGTSSPNNYSGYATLTLNNATNGGIVDYSSNGTRVATTIGDGNGLILAGVGSRYVRIDTNGTERMRITSGGDLLVGGTTNVGTGYKTVIYSGGNVLAQSSTGGNGTAYSAFFNNTTLIGTISNNNNTGVLYNTTSDYRLKENPQPLTGAKDFILALKPKTWNWVQDGSKGIGFIAHEAQEVATQSVTGEKDAVDKDGKPIYQSMQAGSPEIIANLVALVQELSATVEAQAAEIALLKSK